MAKKATTQNGQDRLNEAMLMLIQNQAAFLSQLAQTEQATSQRFVRIEERLGRMEQDMTAVLRVLAEHSRLLERLPEAVRDKIGFKG